MARRYIGGVSSGSSFFKQSNNPEDYTAEDATIFGVTIPKGTYIGAGAVDDNFKTLVYKGDKGGIEDEGDPKHLSAQAYLGRLREKYNWYDLNEGKKNYGYTDKEKFIQDTQPYFGEKFGPSDIEEFKLKLDQKDYGDYEVDERLRYAPKGEVTSQIGFSPEYYEYGPDIKPIESKKTSKIDVEQPEVTMQPAPEIQGGVEPSKSDLFFDRLETAKVYENRPDEDAKGRKKVKTQYVFSDDNPFKPEGRYFMDEADTKGRRKTSGNLNKAREWERKNGLGVQKDIVGYIPSLQYSSALKFDENEFMPDPNRSVSTQVEEKQEQEKVDAKVKQQQKQKQEEQLAEDFDAVNVLDAVGATGIPVISEAGDLASAGISAGRGDYTAAGLSLAGVMAPFAGGKILKEGAKFANKTEMADRINLAMKNNDAKIIESDPRFTKEQKAEILTNSKMPWNQVAKEVEFTNYGKVKDRLQLSKLTSDATEGVGQIGKSIDAKGFKVSDLSPNNVKKIGGKGGRDIYEVTYPNGEKLKFWESSGSGGKPVVLSSRNASKNAKNSKGYFGVVAGQADVSDLGGSNSWFVKGDGWERGYGSKSIEDTGLWLRDLKKSGKLK